MGQESPLEVILHHPALERSETTKLAWLWMWEQLRMLRRAAMEPGKTLDSEPKEGIIHASTAAVSAGIGQTDPRPARLAITNLETLGALKVLDRDVAGKGRLRGQLRIFLFNPSKTLQSQPPGIAHDAQPELFDAGHPARIIPARPSIRRESVVLPQRPQAGQPAGDGAADPAFDAHQNVEQLQSDAHETPDTSFADRGQLQTASRFSGDRPPPDPAFDAHQNANGLHGSMERDIYISPSVHSESMDSLEALVQAPPLRAAENSQPPPAARRPRRFGLWQFELSAACDTSTVMLRERLYECFKEAIGLLVEADALEDATPDSAKREIVEMQQRVVHLAHQIARAQHPSKYPAEPGCHPSIFGRAADAVVDGDLKPVVLAEMFVELLGTARSQRCFISSAGACYNVACQRAFAAVGRPWTHPKGAQAAAAKPR